MPLLKDDIAHCLCCRCVSKSRPLSVIFCAVSLSLFLLGVLLIVVGVVVSSQPIPHNGMIDMYNSYADDYNASSVFVDGGLLPARISVTQLGGGSDDMITALVHNVTLESVPYDKDFVGLDNEDIAMLYANVENPAYSVSDAKCGIVAGILNGYDRQESLLPHHSLAIGGVERLKRHSTRTKWTAPSFRSNHAHTFLFDSAIQQKVVERSSDSDVEASPPPVSISISFLGANSATPAIVKVINETQYTVKDGPAYCPPIGDCTIPFMNAVCQRSYGCGDCYFMQDSAASTLKRTRGSENSLSLSDDPIVCPTPGAACGICAHEIYLSLYCTVVEYDATSGTYKEDPAYGSCNYPFTEETQVYTRVKKYGEPAPNISSVIVRAKGDPYLYLEGLTNGTMTFMITWPAFRSQGPVLVVVGFYCIIMSVILSLILCCLSRKYSWCSKGRGDFGSPTRAESGAKLSFLN